MDEEMKADDAAPAESPAVLWVGRADGPEFAPVFQWLQAHAHLTAAAMAADARKYLAAGDSEPDLIVLAQSCPGEFSEADIGQLRRQAPLTRICELLGSWCEGMASFTEPLGGVIRLAWHQWIARMTPEFARRAAGQAPSWSLPATATDDERLLTLGTVGRGTVVFCSADSAKGDGPRPRDRGLLAVFARQGELARTICDACPSRGWAGIWLRGRRPYLSGIRAIVWDVPRTAADWPADLAELRATAAPIVALLNFPRVEILKELTAAGIVATVSKPLWLDDLFGQLEWL